MSRLQRQHGRRTATAAGRQPASSTTGRAGVISGWQTEFDDPIALSRGRTLVTLQDAATYIMKLRKVERDTPEWQAAGEALIMAAEGRGPLMHARIGMLRALNRHRVRVFTDRKDTHWGKRS